MSGQVKHTPGPLFGDGELCRALPSSLVRLIYKEDGTVVGHAFAEGDARLFAAAPEMLEALKALADEADRLGNALIAKGQGATVLGLASRRARTAIAKAEGK